MLVAICLIFIHIKRVNGLFLTHALVWQGWWLPLITCLEVFAASYMPRYDGNVWWGCLIPHAQVQQRGWLPLTTCLDMTEVIVAFYHLPRYDRKDGCLLPHAKVWQEWWLPLIIYPKKTGGWTYLICWLGRRQTVASYHMLRCDLGVNDWSSDHLLHLCFLFFFVRALKPNLSQVRTNLSSNTVISSHFPSHWCCQDRQTNLFSGETG